MTATEFLREEWKPYPGRVALVTRIVIACMVAMLWVVTFQIPNAALGVFFVLLVSRESPESTLQSVYETLAAYAVGLVVLLAGVILFIDQPLTHFLFVAASLFLVFFGMRTLKSYVAASSFGFMIVTSLPAWDQPYPAEAHLEATLWPVLGVFIGMMVTLLTELVFAADDFKTGVLHRLDAVVDVLRSYVEPGAPRDGVILQLAVTGSGRLRRAVSRAKLAPRVREERAGLVAFVDRLVDLTAHLGDAKHEPSERDRERLRDVLAYCVSLRAKVERQHLPNIPFDKRGYEASESMPLLPALEQTLHLVPEETPEPSLPQGEWKLFVADAFENPEYLHFALKGCLAGLICYLISEAVAWPGLMVAVTTCVITALSTVGSSRQKQFLRVTGAIAGGLVFGIGSQVFLFPLMDSITEFALLFGAVTALSAWIATSSPRLSYFGLQLALAFYLIVFQTFTIDTQLTIGRDRVMGILLGLGVMWLVFDDSWSKLAVVSLKEIFAGNLKLIARLTVVIEEGNVSGMEVLREQLSQGFARLSNQADAVLFEFGRERNRHLVMRSRLLEWQSTAESVLLALLAVTRYRLQSGESAEEVSQLHRVLHDRITGKASAVDLDHAMRATRDGSDAGLLALEERLVELVNELADEAVHRTAS